MSSVDARGMVLRGRARYRLLKGIGRGGMGMVYLAEVERDLEAEGDPSPDEEQMPRQVAVKIMPGTGGAASAVPRAEIGTMKTIRHPKVVRLYDWSFTETMSFAVMDYCQRGSLLDTLRRDGPLAADRVVRLLEDILSALVEAHSRGILHLDIKPANVLLGDDDSFLLADFGIAGMLFQDRARRVVGTPAFMSPEQARGEMSTLDARSDLFMLGATVWQAMTADFSIQRLAPIVTVRQRKQGTLPPLVERVTAELRPLAAIVDSLLAVEPQDRPGTAAEVLHTVRALRLDTDDSPVSDEGIPISPAKASLIKAGLTDPLLRKLFEMERTFFELRLYGDQDIVCAQGEHSYDVFLLLTGGLEIWRDETLRHIQQDEGATIGEVAALVGSPRTATLKAHGETALAVFKGADLEQAARRMPALAVRLMKNLASIVAERNQNRTT